MDERFTDHLGRAGRERDRDHRTWPPLEQQQLNGQQDRGDRCGEHGRHAARRAGDEQRAPLRRGQMQQLPDDAPECAAGDDDRSLGAERAARADTDRARDRLQHGQPGLHTAAAQEDRFHRLGNPVTTDALRAHPRHHAHDQPTDHRHEHAPHPEHLDVGTFDTGSDRPCVGEMRDQADQVQEPQRENRNRRSDDECEDRQTKHRPRRGEITQFTVPATRQPRVWGNDRVTGKPLDIATAGHTTIISGGDILWAERLLPAP